MAKPKHNYRTCRDADCQRLPCVAYKTGFEDGREMGREEASEQTQAGGK